MRFLSWLDGLKANSSRRWTERGSRRKPASLKLSIESLEDRRLLSFAAPVTYTAGSYPVAAVSADFNNDAVLDLAVANNADTTVSVLLGNGDGTFQPAQNYTAGTSLAVGDFNADGKLDLATTNADGVSVLLGNGNDTFQAPRNSTLPGQLPSGYTGTTPLPQFARSI